MPRVVLIGDSIRIGYAPLVAKQLDGKAIVISTSRTARTAATSSGTSTNGSSRKNRTSSISMPVYTT